MVPIPTTPLPLARKRGEGTCGFVLEGEVSRVGEAEGAALGSGGEVVEE